MKVKWLPLLFWKYEIQYMKNNHTVLRAGLNLAVLFGLLTGFSAGAVTKIASEYWICTNATGNFYSSGTGGND